jgi:hypothetical protein
MLTVIPLAATTACGARTELDAPTPVLGPCAASPAAPMAIDPPAATAYDYFAGASIAVGSNFVLFASGIAIGTATGGVAKIGLMAGGPQLSSLVTFATDGRFVQGPLVTDGIDLYFPAAPAERVGYQGPPALAAAPLDGSPLQFLASPDASARYVWDVAVNRQPGVFIAWNPEGPGPSALTHWDGHQQMQIVTTFPEWTVMIVAGADTVFVQTATALYQTPLPAGPPARIRSLAPGNVNAQLLGLNDTALFYSPDGTTIVRRDRTSGTEAMLVSGAALLPDVGAGHTGWADTTWLYYVTGLAAAPQSLRRTPVAGGPSEVLWDDPEHPPTGAVTTDACNVYWLAAGAPWSARSSGPTRLMVRTNR